MSNLKASPQMSCSGLVHFSPSNEYIACIDVFKLKIYLNSTSPMKLLSEHKYKDEIFLLEWSFDSTFILVALTERNVCFIQSVKNQSFSYKIEEGLFGLVNAMFVPNKTDQIITVNSFNMRLTIWSLNDKTSHFITNPKYSDSRGIAFSKHNFPLMCLAERREVGEYIGIFNTKDWSITNHFPVQSKDLKEVKWIDDTDNILIIEGEILCLVYLYSSTTGELLRYIQPYTDKIGINELKISPNNNLISLGCMDGNLYLYYLNNELSFIDIFEHGSLLIDENVYILQESVIKMKQSFYVSVFNKVDVPYRIEIDEDINKVQCNIVSLTEWSSDSKLICTVNQLMPNVLWTWSLSSLSLESVIIFNDKITTMKSSPSKNVLLLLCNCSRVFLYNFNTNTINAYDTGFVSPPTYLEWDKESEQFIIGNNSKFLSCLIPKEGSKGEGTTSQNFYISGGINNNNNITNSNFYNDESGSYSYFNNNYSKK